MAPGVPGVPGGLDMPGLLEVAPFWFGAPGAPLVEFCLALGVAAPGAAELAPGLALVPGLPAAVLPGAG